MPTLSNNLLGLAIIAIQSARELANTLQSNQQTILKRDVEDFTIVLNDLLQATTSNTLGPLDLRLLLIYCGTACKCLKSKTTSATHAGTSSAALQDCTKPTEQYAVNFESILATYTFIIRTALMLKNALPIDKRTVLKSKDDLEEHLKQVESKIWNKSESEQRTTERDTLERDLAVFEQASNLLVPSIGGHDPQKKKDAEAAQGGIQSYLVHIREEHRIIDHELSQQDQLAEEKDCVINCLAVCRQALDNSNCPMLKDFVAEEDTAQVVTSDGATGKPHQSGDLELLGKHSGHSLEFSSPSGGQQVIGVLPRVRTSLKAVTIRGNGFQILGSFTDKALQELSTRMATAKNSGSIDRPEQMIPRDLTQNKVTVQSLGEKRASVETGSNCSAGASHVRFDNIQTGAGKFDVDVTHDPADRIKGEFSSGAEWEKFYAQRKAGRLAKEVEAADEQFNDKYGPGHSLVED